MLFLITIAPLYAEQQAQVDTRAELLLSNRINFRAGFSTATNNGQPTICVEGAVYAGLSFETCGTGYGFIHHEAGTDFVHFRALSVFLLSLSCF